MRIVVLGAGFGGLELTTRLSDEFGDDADVVLIDQSDGFVFGFSKLDVMFGRALPAAVRHPYRDLVKPGVRFVQTTVRSIDPVAKRVETDAGPFDADVLVVALGADLHPSATPGLVEGGHEFYTVPGAFALARRAGRLRGRTGDRRRHLDPVQVPAGAERDRAADARLPHRARAARPLRDLARHAAAGAPSRRRRPRRRRCSSPSPSAASSGTPSGWCASSTPPARSRCSATAARCPTTCSSASRCTGRRPSSRQSGLTVDGWIPVDPLTLETAVPGRLRGRRRDQRRHAEGRRVRRGPGGRRGRPDQRAHPGRTPSRRSTTATACATSSSATTRSPGSTSRSSAARRPTAGLEGPSEALAADKVEFGSEPDPPLVRPHLAGGRAGRGLTPPVLSIR